MIAEMVDPGSDCFAGTCRFAAGAQDVYWKRLNRGQSALKIGGADRVTDVGSFDFVPIRATSLQTLLSFIRYKRLDAWTKERSEAPRFDAGNEP